MDFYRTTSVIRRVTIRFRCLKCNSSIYLMIFTLDRTKKNRKKVITPDDINSLFSERKVADDEEAEDEEEEEEDNQLTGDSDEI